MLKLFALVLFLAKSATLSALEFNVPRSTVQEVTIGGTIAEVTRAFNLQNVPNGFHSVVVDHLPNTVDEKSIQVVGLGDAEVVSTIIQNQVIAREHDVDFVAMVSSVNSVHTKLTEGLHSLTMEHRRVSARIISLDTYIQDAMHTSASRTTPLTLEQLTQTLDYQEKALSGLNEKLVILDRKINATQTSISTLLNIGDKLQKHGYYQNLFLSAPAPSMSLELVELMKTLPTAEKVWPSSQPTKQLHINIHVPGTTAVKTLAFTINYMTSPASWQAEYDLRLDSPSDSSTTTTAIIPSKEYKLRVGMYATVMQSTQENWADVQLRLSTSQPQQFIYPLSSPQRTSITFQSDQPEGMYYNEGMTTRVGGGSMKQMKRGRSFVQADMMMASDAAGAAPMMAEMSNAEVGITGQAGSLGSTVVFSPSYPVNISSNQRVNVNYAHSQYPGRTGIRPVPEEPVLLSAPVTSTRLFIKEFSLSPQVFTYAVPTMHTAGLRAWVLNNDGEPLLLCIIFV